MTKTRKRFDNEKRSRYYGIRVGDTITVKYSADENLNGLVVEYGFMDNNRVIVQFDGSKEYDSCVAEYCKIVVPVEDKPHSVCAFIRNKETGLFLGVSRKYDPNDFGFCGGKVDPGETPEEAMVREAKEETGLDIVIIEEIHTEFYGGYNTHCYIADYSGEFSYDKEKETGRVAWVTKQDLLDGCFGDYNAGIFSLLY
jgi:8-oxo-dGTP pyrophosphatase MutT (NUDIX family)